jgi:hypothetical protein
MKNQSAFQGYSAFIIMVFVSIVLLAFSFWTISRRTNSLSTISQETPTEQIEEEKPEYEWADYNSSTAGVAFKYPKNIFTGQETRATEAGSVTRVFLGTGANGTLTVSTIKKQFDPGNVVDPSSNRLQKASAINVGGRIGYQYQIQTTSCTNKLVQFANGAQTVVFAFNGCESDEEPLVSADQALFLQVLASAKLTPQEPEPDEEEVDAGVGGGIDTLPPELESAE